MTVRNPAWLQAVSAAVSAEEDRLARTATLAGGAGLLKARSGVRSSLDFVTTQHGTPNMSVDVAKGQAIVEGHATNQGAYVVTTDASITLTVSAANATNPRNDIVYVRVQDQDYGGSVDSAAVELATGTPAVTPSDPSIPNDCLAIARVRVDANVTSIVNAKITDIRPYTAALGGLIPVVSSARPSTPWSGMGLVETDTLALSFWDAGTSTWQRYACVKDSRGLVAYGYNSVNTGAFTSPGLVVQTLSAVPMISGRRYKVEGYVPIGNNGGSEVAGDYLELVVRVGGATKNAWSANSLAATAGLVSQVGRPEALITDASTGTFTVDILAKRLSGAGTHQLLAGGDYNPFIAVFDEGANI